MGQTYSKEVSEFRKKSKEEAKAFGFLQNKEALLHYMNKAQKQTKV